MKEPTHRHLDHQTPFWVTESPTYFITICTEPRGLNQLCHEVVGNAALEAVRHYHDRQKWFCHLAMLMPDHVHFLLSFPDGPSYSVVVGDWKRWLKRHHKIVWQENFFDHRIRGEEQDRWKADYIQHNPVRAGLVDRWEDWPYKWLPESC
jgi:REP element-mobilizing transposase RayT